MKIFSILAILILLTTCFLFTSCEEDSKSDGVAIPGNGIVTMKNQPNGNYEGSFVIDDDRVILVKSTAIIRKQRESCSGFDNANVYDIKVGDYVEFIYDSLTTDWVKGIYVADYIDIWNSNCINPKSDNTPCGCNNPCDDN